MKPLISIGSFMPKKIFLESNQFNVNVTTIFLQYLSIQICYFKGPGFPIQSYGRFQFFKTTIFQKMNLKTIRQVRLGQVRLCLVRIGQLRLGQVRLGQVRLGQVRLGQVRLGQVMVRLAFVLFKRYKVLFYSGGARFCSIRTVLKPIKKIEQKHLVLLKQNKTWYRLNRTKTPCPA